MKIVEIKISLAEDETRIHNSSYTLLSWDDNLCTAAETGPAVWIKSQQLVARALMKKAQD